MSKREIYKGSFYFSYYEVGTRLDNKQRLEYYDAILSFMFDGDEPENLDPVVSMLFTLIRPSILADINRKNGGAPEGNDNATKGETCRKCGNYYSCHRKGQDGKICEDFTPPHKTTAQNNTKQPHKTTAQINKTNEVEVKEEVEEEVKLVNTASQNVTENVTPTPTNSTTPLDIFTKKIGLSLTKKARDDIGRRMYENAISPSYLDFIWNKVSRDYQGKSLAERTKLFVKGVTSWDDCLEEFRETEREKKEKAEQKRRLAPPRVCSICGSRLEVGAIPNSVECPKCRENGVRTWWELDGNEWKLSRH